MERFRPTSVTGWIHGVLLMAPLLALWLCAAPCLAATAARANEPASLAVLTTQFAEPLVATGPHAPDEDAALARAITLYQHRGAVDDFSALDGFLAAYPQSTWRLALFTNLGLAHYHYGYFLKAIDDYEQAWSAGRAATDLPARALADRAAGELLKMHARLGHADRLATLLAEMANRGLTGQATELRDGAREGLWMMQHNPGVAYLCGPMALKNLLLARGTPSSALGFLDSYRSGPQGVTLAEVGHLADHAKLPYRLIHRDADQPIPVPSIIHWKANHFAAILSHTGDRYQVQDPTFGQSLSITRGAIDAEGSGYFLVPDAQPTAWRAVTAEEAIHIHGMGYTDTNDPDAVTPDDPCACGGSSSAGGNDGGNSGANIGMTGYNFKEMVVSLNLTDTPVGYVPPKGPSTRVMLTYNQREAGQPANFSFFNISPKWTLNWLSYISDDPTTPGSSVTRVVAGGGEVNYSGYSTTTNSFTPEVNDGAILSVSTGAPTTYRRTLPDGSVEIYGNSNGATSYPRLIFLTKTIDRFGNAVTLTYDGKFRLTALTDATGRATAFAYANASFPLLVTAITDPFGRTAGLAYDTSGRLIQITDELGLKSQFTYDSSSLINALTTPYGTTQFAYGDNGNSRFLQATDPLGYTERLEYVQGAPGVPGSDPANLVPVGLTQPFNAYLSDRDTFYWNKHAFAVAAGNYTMARNRHWTHLASNTNVTANSIESVKYPLESRIWYEYPGQAGTALGNGQSGTLNLPTGIGRVLDNGATQLSQFQYNSLANPSAIMDPAGRQTQYTYAANNIDVTSVQQNTASGMATIASYTYNAAHLPLTSVDAAGKTTTHTYNAAGQLTTTTDPLGHVTTYIYNSLGQLTSVVNPAGKTAASFVYDSLGRVATKTDSEGYAVTYAYDALDRLTRETHPDGTARSFVYKNLDLVSYTDRQGRTTTATYDADRNVTSITDPLGHVTHRAYYQDGTLASITDPNGNVTKMIIDVESRLVAKQYPDGTYLGFGYEANTSRVLFASDRLNQIKQFGYTSDGQLASVQHFNSVHPTQTVSFSYDPYFPRLASMTDASGTTTYGYQPIGAPGALRLASEQPPYANAAITYQYDAAGHMTGRSVGGDAETFAYDNLDRVTSHVDDLGTFARTYLGQTQQLASQSNGTVGTAWTYAANTSDRRLTGIANTPKASAYTLTTTPEYDVTAIADAFNNQTWTYSNDAADRLLGATSSAGPKYAYAYDAAHNLSSIGRPSGTTGVTSNALNQIAKLGTAGFTYDGNGNLLRDYARTYQWDADNRLIAIFYIATPGLETTFRYDGMGRRIAIGTISNGIAAETRYGWCGATLCQSRSGTDVVLRRYLAEGESTPAANTKLYYGVDQLGSVHDALSASTGTSVAHYDYEPYGLPTGTQKATATDFRYAGLFDHQQSGLYLGNYRAYDPVAGRWLQRDPSGETSDLNLYAYANGNPVIGADPLGLWTGQIGIGGGGNIPIFGGGGLNIFGGIGIAFDGNGNVGWYWYGGAGGYVGTPGAFGGVQLGASNAKTICDLGGPFGNVSVGGFAGGGASVDGFAGPSANGPVVGGNVTIGGGLGAGGSVGGSYTGVHPF